MSMWEYVYKDYIGKQGFMQGYKGIEEFFALSAFFMFAIDIPLSLIMLIGETPDTFIDFFEKNYFCIITMFLGILNAIIAWKFLEKRENTKLYHMGELKRLKRILEEKYQLNTIKKKKEFLKYVEKEKAQINQSFFDRKTFLTIVSIAVAIFSAIMSGLLGLFDTLKMNLFILFGGLLFLISILGVVYCFGSTSRNSLKLLKCSRFCNLTQEVILFSEDLIHVEENIEQPNYTGRFMLCMKQEIRKVFTMHMNRYYKKIKKHKSL